MLRRVSLACALALLDVAIAAAQAPEGDGSPPAAEAPATEPASAAESEGDGDGSPDTPGTAQQHADEAEDGAGETAAHETAAHETATDAEAAETGAEPEGDTETADAPEEAPTAAAGDADAASPPTPVPDAQAPKVAVAVVGDPDPALRAAARRVERAIDGTLRLPFDPGLRAALRGEPGQSNDGLDEVRTARRRLSADEAHDAPILASLGRRAGAGTVAVVRAGTTAPELVVLDVRNAAFYEGTLSLESVTSQARIAGFVAHRARASERGPEPPSPPEAAPNVAPAAATVAPDPPEQPAHDDFVSFVERYWPYGAAAILLGVLITAIAVTGGFGGSGAGATQPVLQFMPGGM